MSALVRRRSFGAVVALAVCVLSVTAAAVYAGSARTSFSAAPTRISATAASRTATPAKVVQTTRFTPHGHRWS